MIDKKLKAVSEEAHANQIIIVFFDGPPVAYNNATYKFSGDNCRIFEVQARGSIRYFNTNGIKYIDIS